jgi:hypothetical protein
MMIHPMQQVKTGLEKIVAHSVRRAPADQGPVLAWPLACGRAVATRTSALDFVGGTLRVQVPNAGWRRELQSLAAQYLAVINRYASESVMRIEFVLEADKNARGSLP